MNLKIMKTRLSLLFHSPSDDIKVRENIDHVLRGLLGKLYFSEFELQNDYKILKIK